MMPNYTKDQVFLDVITHLKEQGIRAWSKELNCCAYRGENGTKCAVGYLIPDNEYKTLFEGKSVGDILGAFPNDLQTLRKIIADIGIDNGGAISFLSLLQSFHDRDMYIKNGNITKETQIKKIKTIALEHEISQETLDKVLEIWNEV